MVGAAVIVGAPLVKVFPDAAVFQFAADAFTGDRLTAEGTLEKAAREWVLWGARAAVAALHDVLAGVERRPVDKPLVAANAVRLNRGWLGRKTCPSRSSRSARLLNVSAPAA